MNKEILQHITKQIIQGVFFGQEARKKPCNIRQNMTKKRKKVVQTLAFGRKRGEKLDFMSKSVEFCRILSKKQIRALHEHKEEKEKWKKI
jgi:hypothetical protein